ncbi:hypothetical protein M433DRAFT_9313 [Acidomyces richmondensis BFW]|nr:hypothetical protein M433DRAFT_9313 [Acidomyces richmondensis BFW]
MAEEIRYSRYQISSVPPSYERPIESARYTAVSLDTVKTWFEAVTETRLQHQH